MRVVAAGFVVVLAVLLAVLSVSPAKGVPRVDYIPADASCAPDSPAVLRSQQDRE
jgi:hypothetical protein